MHKNVFKRHLLRLLFNWIHFRLTFITFLFASLKWIWNYQIDSFWSWLTFCYLSLDTPNVVNVFPNTSIAYYWITKQGDKIEGAFLFVLLTCVSPLKCLLTTLSFEMIFIDHTSWSYQIPKFFLAILVVSLTISMIDVYITLELGIFTNLIEPHFDRKNLTNWERFQLNITRYELYSENSSVVDDLLKDMSSMPIVRVGK